MSDPITASSGISWEVLFGILTPFALGGLGTAGFLWRAIVSSTATTVAAVEKLDVKIAKVECDARDARKNLWKEHNEQRDHVTTLRANMASMKGAEVTA